MDEVEIKKDQLISVLKKNRDEHKRLYDEAVEGYKEAILKKVGEAYRDLKSGKLISMNEYSLPVPPSHVAEYEDALEMLELSVYDTVTLTKREFRQYVQDKWDWSHDNSTLMTYSSLRSNKL